MRRPSADLEEKQEPLGTPSAIAEPNLRRQSNEVSKIDLDECRDREADIQRRPMPTVTRPLWMFVAVLASAEIGHSRLGGQRSRWSSNRRRPLPRSFGML